MYKTSDDLNHGYISHNRLVYTFYRIIDFWGYRLWKRKPLNLNVKRLLFINLGLIGDLILFRYVINDFLQLDYRVTILIRDEYKFLFTDLKNIKIITVRNYREKTILSGLFKLIKCLRQNGQIYDVSLHFRGYLGTGILSTYISGVSDAMIGYPTSGFGFLLNHKLNWIVGVHESIHLLELLQVLRPDYKSINLNCYELSRVITQSLYQKYQLTEKNYIIIHATSQNIDKNIPVEVLKYTINYLLNNYPYTIVFVGVSAEASYVNDCINNIDEELSSRLVCIFTESFFNVYNLIAGARLFIGVDSSLAHISSGLNLSKIIYWHKLNLYTQWAPLGGNFYIINDQSDKINFKAIINKIIDQGIL